VVIHMKNRLCSNIVAKTWYLFLLILILHFVTGMIPTSSSSNFEVNSLSLRQTISGSTQIIGNQEFLEFVNEYGLEGDGTKESPFVISNIDFVRLEEVIESEFIPLFHLEGISYYLSIGLINVEDNASFTNTDGHFGSNNIWIQNVSNIMIANTKFTTNFNLAINGHNTTIFNNEFARGTEIRLVKLALSSTLISPIER